MMYNQDHVYAFYLITANSLQYFRFEWDEVFNPLHVKLLNMISNWPKVSDWKDTNYKFLEGCVYIMSDEIKQKTLELKDEFIQNGKDEHKATASDLCKMIGSIPNNQLFFIYRLACSQPSQTVLLRIMTELRFVKNGKTKEEADIWFDNNARSLFDEYTCRIYIDKKQGEPDKKKRVCRFCHNRAPEVAFKKVAHAIPESIGGHKKLICFDECDDCNAYFGANVESHLCNWLDLRRSQFGVRKKSGGIPKAYGQNYLVEDQETVLFGEGLEKESEFKALGSSIVTQQGIYRALCKIAIDLIEPEFLSRLTVTTEWIRTGSPKVSTYPQIGQMCDLDIIDRPQVFIFTRKDNLDKDDAPLHFCILRIFDLAYLFVLPNVDGRMLFKPSYTAKINTEALKVFRLNGNWDWKSYDSIEKRNPHVLFDVSNFIRTESCPNTAFDSSKLRKEKKPKNNVDFEKPIVSNNDIELHNIAKIDFDSNFDQKSVNNVYGIISCDCIFDLQANSSLFVQLKVRFENAITKHKVAVLRYDVCFNRCIYKHQFKYTGSTLSINQELFVQVLEIALNSLFNDLKDKYNDFPFRRESLGIQNVRELLTDMFLVFVENGLPKQCVKGKRLWDSGMQN